MKLPVSLLTLRKHAFVTGKVLRWLYLNRLVTKRMAKRLRSRWWEHEEKVLRRFPDVLEVPHPSTITAWVDDMKQWPAVTFAHIVNYLVFAEGVDGERMENHKSMESYNYFQSGKVGFVQVAKASADLLLLKGEVTPSLAVNSTKHQAWVLTTSSGVVETAGCSCKAGQGKSCSHAGAILWKLEYAASSGRSGHSCTDTEQRWNRGTLKNLEPRRMKDISFKRHKPNSKFGDDERRTATPAAAAQPHLPPILQFWDHGEFQNHMAQSSVGALYLLQGSLASKCFGATIAEPQVPKRVDHDDHTSGILSCQKCSDFYFKYVDINRGRLEERTRQQSESSLWHDARKLRVTASSAKKVPVRKTTKPDSFLREHFYPTFRGNHATQHGKNSEPKALDELKELGLPCVKRGSVLSPTKPWLSASPDGMVYTEDDNFLVEVKCPFNTENTLEDMLQAGKCVCDIEVVDGKYVLKRNGPRGYYLQLQIGMHCTQTKNSKFFVWTKEGHILLDVTYDEVYLEDVVKRLELFYFGTMLPRMVDDFEDGRFKLCSEYISLAGDVHLNC